jgi:serine/threonine-protein phosphatase 6 regulatory ankyrin repeat subunit B
MLKPNKVDTFMSWAHRGDLRRLQSSDIKDMNVKDSEGRTALMWAALSDRVKVVQHLIKHKADPDLVSKDNQTALTVAAGNGYLDLFTSLSGSADHDSALCLAAGMGHLKFVATLLKFGKASDLNGAIQAAASDDHLHVVKFLIKDHQKNSDILHTALHTAVINGKLKVVKYLIPLLTDPLNTIVCDCHFSLLHLAAENGELAMVQYLVEDLHFDMELKADAGNTALHIAVTSKHADVILYLHKAGANLEAKKINGCTALHSACVTGNMEMLQVLESCGANVKAQDNEGCTPLHGAAFGGFLPIVSRLVENLGADVMARSLDGSTPIHAAVANNSVDVIVYLQHKADLQATDDNGSTPIFTAVREGKWESLTCLLEKCGVDLHGVDREGWTLLHVAASKGRLDMVQYLLAMGISPNVKDNLGFTALYYSAFHNQAMCAALLQSRTTVQEFGGLTPVQIAAANGHVPVLEVLVTADNIDLQTEHGFTALMAAAMNGRRDAVRFLAIHGAQLELGSATGFTALHLASENGHWPVVKVLLRECEVSVEPLTVQKCTPLMCATQNKHIKIAKKLVKRFGADPKRDSECGTAAMMARHAAQSDESMLPFAEWLDRECEYCGKWGHYRCDGCEQVYYCDKECQKMDWRDHKPDCKK